MVTPTKVPYQEEHIVLVQNRVLVWSVHQTDPSSSHTNTLQTWYKYEVLYQDSEPRLELN